MEPVAEANQTGGQTIRRLFDFISNPDPYTADAVVISCFDARIRLARDEFLRRNSVAQPDLVVIAGGSLSLSSPRTAFDRNFVLEQVQLAIRLHRASRVILMSHSDCATYGGLAAFNGNRRSEMEHHARELCRASAIIRKEFHGLLVERVFLTFDGLFSIADDESAER